MVFFLYVYLPVWAGHEEDGFTFDPALLGRVNFDLFPGAEKASECSRTWMSSRVGGRTLVSNFLFLHF